MAKLLGSARIDFLGRNAHFQRAAKENVSALARQRQAMRRSREAMNRYNSSVRSAVKSLGAFAASAGGVVTIGALSGRIKSVSEYGATLFETSKRLGIATDQLQLWQRAVEGEGASLKVANKALATYVRALGEARNAAQQGKYESNSYAENFRRLGISADELLALDIPGSLLAVADGFREMSSQTDVAAIGLEIFGTRGAAMVNVLQDGSAAVRENLENFRRFGVVTTQEASRLKALSQAMTDLATEVRTTFAKAVAQRADDIAAAVDSMRKAANAAVVVFAKLVANLDRIVAYAVAAAAVMATKWVAGFAAALIGVKGLTAALVALRLALIRTGIGILIVLLGEAFYQFSRLADQAGGFGEALKMLKEVGMEVVDRLKLGWDRLMLSVEAVWLSISVAVTDALADAATGIENFIDNTIRAFKGLQGGLVKLWQDFSLADIMEAVLDTDHFVERQVLAFRSGFENSFNTGAGLAAGRISDALTANAKAQTAALEEVLAERARVEAQLYAPLTSVANLRTAVQDASLGTPLDVSGLSAGIDWEAEAGAVDEVAETIRDAREETHRWADSTRAVGDRFGDLVRTAVTDLDSLISKLGEVRDALLDIVLDAALYKPVSEGITSILDSIVKGVGDSATVPAKASGGYASGPFLAGEFGPELVVPAVPSKIYNKAQTASMMGGGVTLNFAPVIQSADSAAVQQAIDRARPEFVEAAMAAVARSAGRPGRFRTLVRG